MPSELRVDKVSSTTSPYDPVFSTTGGALSHRNMIINGDFRVGQRGNTLVKLEEKQFQQIDLDIKYKWCVRYLEYRWNQQTHQRTKDLEIHFMQIAQRRYYCNCKSKC